jgi:hypothetical protein
MRRVIRIHACVAARTGVTAPQPLRGPPRAVLDRRTIPARASSLTGAMMRRCTRQAGQPPSPVGTQHQAGPSQPQTYIRTHAPDIRVRRTFCSKGAFRCDLLRVRVLPHRRAPKPVAGIGSGVAAAVTSQHRCTWPGLVFARSSRGPPAGPPTHHIHRHHQLYNRHMARCITPTVVCHHHAALWTERSAPSSTPPYPMYARGLGSTYGCRQAAIPPTQALPAAHPPAALETNPSVIAFCGP